MAGELSTLGVSADAERLYRRVLRNPPADLRSHAEALGWGHAHAQLELRTLVAGRLLQDGGDGVLVPEPPGSALNRLIERESTRLEARRRELDDARDVIADFAGEHLTGLREGSEPTGLETVPDDLLVSTIEHAVRATSGPIRQCATTVGFGPMGDEVMLRLLQGELARGRVMHAIYPLAVLRERSVHVLAWLRGWEEIGQQQRLLEEIPHAFVLFGSDLLLARPVWGSNEGDFVVVNAHLVIQAFTRVFDETWRVSLPVPRTVGETEDSARLLALLAAGFKDEAIARYLGVSLRTVRRRVALLMEELGAQTRFQLGSAAERRGLLDSESG